LKLGRRGDRCVKADHQPERGLPAWPEPRTCGDVTMGEQEKTAESLQQRGKGRGERGAAGKEG